MYYRIAYEKSLSALRSILESIDEMDVETMVSILLNAERIFCLGLGRNSLVLRCFAMRLSQLGLSVYVVGETTTPSAWRGDTLLVSSASGETESSLSVVRSASGMGVKVLLLSASPNSAMSKLASTTVHIPVGKLASNEYEFGMLFEEAVFMLSEAVVNELMQRSHKSYKTVLTNHANLEHW